MKREELEIGDWVYHDDIVFGREIAKIHRLNKNKNDVTIGMTVYRGDGTFSVAGYILTSPDNDIHPIPLTPEILESNGFVKWQGGLVLIGDEISCRYEDGNLTIKQGYRDNEGVLIERLLVNIECLSVHQLQHALRLAGVEKEMII